MRKILFLCLVAGCATEADPDLDTTSDSEISSDASVDPFSPSSCTGPAMTLAQAEARLPTATAFAEIGAGTLHAQSRDCAARAGGSSCTAWRAAPASEEPIVLSLEQIFPSQVDLVIEDQSDWTAVTVGTTEDYWALDTRAFPETPSGQPATLTSSCFRMPVATRHDGSQVTWTETRGMIFASLKTARPKPWPGPAITSYSVISGTSNVQATCGALPVLLGGPEAYYALVIHGGPFSNDMTAHWPHDYEWDGTPLTVPNPSTACLAFNPDTGSPPTRGENGDLLFFVQDETTGQRSPAWVLPSN